MNKIFIGGILGLGIIINVDASLISRNFLDETLNTITSKLDLQLEQKATITELNSLYDFVGFTEEMKTNKDNAGYYFYRESIYDSFGATFYETYNSLLQYIDDVNNVFNIAFQNILYGDISYEGIRQKNLVEINNDIKSINNKVPNLPTGAVDGKYTLTATKIGNQITYSWEIETQ